ncbi:hypothetical protein J4G07_10650 [Candidatus Poribacteria bacterium]|nr:hypothetical protein [Candidatus Poribacteria bacterium]
MKQNLAALAVTVLMLMNITGCSVVRFAETRMGYGLKKANKTRMDLDFQLGFNATDRSLRITLEHQPYAIYKPRITLTDLGVGLASLGLLGKVLYDNWDHDYTFTFVDDTFDWYGSEPWEKAVMIGVPADILLYWAFSYPFDRKAVKIQRESLTDHPYRIELPDHGNIGRNYRTTTGTEQIYIRNFLSEIGNPSFLKDIESLKFQAFTEVGGKQHNKDHTVSGIIVPNSDSPSPPVPQPDPEPDPVPEPAPDPVPIPQVEVNAQWVKDRLRAGERAILKITVRNTGKNTLTEFTVTTASPTPHFSNWEIKFGNITSGTSETRALGFSSDPEMTPQDVPVTLHFEEANGIVHQAIERILHIIE